MWVGVIRAHFTLLDLNLFFHNYENSAECMQAWSDSTAWKIEERMSININTAFDRVLWGGKLSDLVSHG